VLKEIRARMKTSEGLAGTPSRSVLEDARRMLLTKRSSTTQAERLAATRRALSESLSTGVNYTDAFRSAPRADKTAKALMEKMDDTLNASTGNKWTQYLENYSSLSKPINEMEATTKISQELTDPLKKGKLLRQSELASAVKKHGEDIFGSKLTPEKQAAYQKVADDIAKERITDRLNASGSTDDMNQLLEATKGLEGPVIGFRSIGLGALRGLQRMMPQSLDKSLSDLMLDPKLYSKAMADALRRGGNKTMADRLSENMKTAIGTSTMQRMGD
jgi:uncharacterized protein YdcH (DUF465 family)